MKTGLEFWSESLLCKNHFDWLMMIMMMSGLEHYFNIKH